MRVIDMLRMPPLQKRKPAKRLLKFRIVPQKDRRHASADAQVIRQLRDRVRRGVPWEPHGLERGLVEVVVRGDDGRLVVCLAVLAEKRGRHPGEVTPVKDVVVVAQRHDEVTEGHAEVGVDLCGVGQEVENGEGRKGRTGAQRPDEGVTLGDQSPRRAERQESDALVAGTSAEQVAQERVPAIVRQTDDGNGGEEREGVLRDPLPEEDTGELA